MNPAETIIYHADPITLELLGSGIAFVGPAGDTQIPAFASVSPPPEIPERHVAVMVGAPDPVDHTCQWQVIQDWRGVPLYGTTDGVPFAIAQGGWPRLGPLPEGVTDLPRPSPLHTWQETSWKFDLDLAKAAKVAEINAERASREFGTFVYGGKRYMADDQSERRLLSLAQVSAIAKAAGRDYSAVFIAADNQEVELDADGVVETLLALSAHRDSCQKTAASLKQAISVAADEQALAAIHWPLDEA